MDGLLMAAGLALAWALALGPRWLLRSPRDPLYSQMVRRDPALAGLRTAYVVGLAAWITLGGFALVAFVWYLAEVRGMGSRLDLFAAMLDGVVIPGVGLLLGLIALRYRAYPTTMWYAGDMALSGAPAARVRGVALAQAAVCGAVMLLSGGYVAAALLR